LQIIYTILNNKIAKNNKGGKNMLKEKLLEDMKVSMRDKKVIRKNVIQMVRAAILQVEKDKQIDLNDEQITEIIAKESKKRKDSLVDYEKSGRQDLIDQINEEIAILAEYLPQPLSIEEIEKVVEEVIDETGASTMKDMGKVMKEAKAKIGPAADGKTINEIVKQKLSKQ
jgi:gatB/yqeY